MQLHIFEIYSDPSECTNKTFWLGFKDSRGRRIKKPEKTTATEPTQSEWRWATTRKYAPGSLPKVGRSGTSARIALLQQVRLEGWSTRLSGRRKGGCGENGTDAPPEALDTKDCVQPARHGQQGR